jgi:exopolysaccharide biosynthesis polyprenyl glycosylphosphotransferase
MSTTGAPTRMQRAIQERTNRPAGADFERRRQQRIIATGDAAAITLAFALVTSVTVAFGPLHGSEVVYTAAAAAIGLLSLRAQGMWRSHKIAVRWVELAAIARASTFILGGVLVVDRILGPALRLRWITAAAVLAFVLLLAWRSIFRSWLTVNRRQGRLVQSTIVIGTDERAMELVRIAEVHPEAGTRIIGIIGSHAEAEAAGRADLWLGELADAAGVTAVIDAEAPDKIIVSSGDIAPALLAGLIRAEHAGGAEVVVHAGLPGVDATRLTVSAIANEAVLHVDASQPTLLGRAFKRTFDVVVAGTLLMVAAPVMAAVALLVKKEDGGPVFFRQQRVGRGSHEFGMIKFRTMCVDAEAKLAAMQADNQRSGPLFKLARDPRVTKIGHILRRTSLDELPQLLNVVKGDMSLVGPRPALRREVDAFPAELHARHAVRPGITGLWQVEARDNPEFDAYQRLDLHYVENWSPGLDIVLLLGTAEQMLMRPFASKTHGEMISAGPTDDAFAAAA